MQLKLQKIEFNLNHQQKFWFRLQRTENQVNHNLLISPSNFQDQHGEQKDFCPARIRDGDTIQPVPIIARLGT